MSPEIHVSAILICDQLGRVLHVRKQGTSVFMLPGGKPEAGEQPSETALREFAEELGTSLNRAQLVDHGKYSAAAANEAGYTVVAHVFSHPFVGAVTAAAEIETLEWIHPSDSRTDIAPLNTQYLFPALMNGTIAPPA